MGRNRLASARKRLPGRVLVLVLTVSSAAGWPRDAGTSYAVVRDRSDRVVPVRTRACLAHGDAGDTRGMTAHMNVNPKAGNRALPGVSSRSREGSGLRVSTSEIGESN
jgi:hypothetical protein